MLMPYFGSWPKLPEIDVVCGDIVSHLDEAMFLYELNLATKESCNTLVAPITPSNSAESIFPGEWYRNATWRKSK